MAKITVISTSQKEKISAVNADGEIFGRLLVAAKHRDIDLKEVLSYELCSAPIALRHPDGTLRKTGKSTLKPLLEMDVRFVSLHAIQNSLGQLLCKCLPSFHALTGCDSTSALSRIRKKKAWRVLIKKNQIQGYLSRLGESSSLQGKSLSLSSALVMCLGKAV